MMIGILAYAGMSHAQVPASEAKVKVYCEVSCVKYNLMKKDVNAIVDFGIADRGRDAEGWIYNSETGKKYSFASPMSVFRYMADRGWEYKDAIVVKENSDLKWHFILTKEMPVDYTDNDIVGDIDYRN